MCDGLKTLVSSRLIEQPVLVLYINIMHYGIIVSIIILIHAVIYPFCQISAA